MFSSHGNFNSLAGNELVSFNNLLKTTPDHPRYKYLKLQNNIQSHHRTRLANSVGIFSDHLDTLNNLRIQQEILSNDHLKKYRYAILGVFSCTANSNFSIETFIPQTIKETFKNDHPSILKDTIYRNQQSTLDRNEKVWNHTGKYNDSPDSETKMLANKDNPNYGTTEITDLIAALRYLVEGAGYSFANWSLAFDQEAFTFSQPSVDFYHPKTWKSLLSRTEDKQLLDHFNLGAMDTINNYKNKIEKPYIMTKEGIQFCTLLREKSLHSLTPEEHSPYLFEKLFHNLSGYVRDFLYY